MAAFSTSDSAFAVADVRPRFASERWLDMWSDQDTDSTVCLDCSSDDEGWREDWSVASPVLTPDGAPGLFAMPVPFCLVPEVRPTISEPEQLSLLVPPGDWGAGPSSSAVASVTMVAQVTRTTLVLKNLPKDWTGAMLAEKLDVEGFAGLYDFVYVPLSLQLGTSFGYAFTNMASADLAACFLDKFQGALGWTKDQSLEVEWCEHQGLAIQIEKYRNSPLMHESVQAEARPLLFRNGLNTAFPEPTKDIKKPRGIRGKRQLADCSTYMSASLCSAQIFHIAGVSSFRSCH